MRLSCFDDRRHVHPCGVHTLAFMHRPPDGRVGPWLIRTGPGLVWQSCTGATPPTGAGVAAAATVGGADAGVGAGHVPASGGRHTTSTKAPGSSVLRSRRRRRRSRQRAGRLSTTAAAARCMWLHTRGAAHGSRLTASWGGTPRHTSAWASRPLSRGAVFSSQVVGLPPFVLWCVCRHHHHPTPAPRPLAPGRPLPPVPWRPVAPCPPSPKAPATHHASLA